MGTIVLITLLLIGILLEGKLLQAAKLCPTTSKQISSEPETDIKDLSTHFLPTVKFAKEEPYLLNIINLYNAPKGAQSAPVYTDIHTIWG